MVPDSSLDLSAFRSDHSMYENQTHVHWSDVATASPYFTELESARYCRCGVARLRSWEDRGYVTVRVDVDSRRFYVRDELDRAMAGLVDPAAEVASGVAARPGETNRSASATLGALEKPSTPGGRTPSAKKPGRGRPPKSKPVEPGAQPPAGVADGDSSETSSRAPAAARRGRPPRPALPFTDPERDTRRRGGKGGPR